MNPHFQYQNYNPTDFEALLAMAQKLWKDIAKGPLMDLLKQTANNRMYNILLAKAEDGSSVGFAIFSIRTDYVEGAAQSPTGYLEGIYVEVEYRKHGVAKALLQMGEQWLRENNCTQIGSDTWLSDTNSRNFHKKLGFWEEEELVHFLKNLN
jgi:aminoglycoside 6'-N-acetyltransferase I